MQTEASTSPSRCTWKLLAKLAPVFQATLPARYHGRWQQPFEASIAAQLRDDMTILDIGAGRHPTIAASDRLPGTRYIGLDISADELHAAGADAYDEVHAVDATCRIPGLVGRVDLAVSWQVFEHVKPLDSAIDNIHEYLCEGGALISFFSGKWSAFGVVNQLIPNAIGLPLVERIMRRRQVNEPVFPAFYHRCSARGLRKITTGWRAAELMPLYCGATYFNFSPALTRLYLRYEELVRARGAENLATHYLLVAYR